jgi:hypothetical protein
MKRLERDGLIVRCALLPAPREEAEPCERQGPYGGLMGLALVALLLIVHLRPEGRPDRLRRPCDAGVSETLGTLEAPAPPGFLAAPCGHRRAPGLLLSCGGGGSACALVATGDPETRSADGARSWAGRAQGASGRALRARRAGGVASGAGLPGAPERGDAGLHQQRMGGEDAGIGGAGYGRCDGLETRCDDSGVAPVRLAAEGRAGGTARAWRRLEGRPAPQEVAAERGVLLLQPGPHGRDRVLEGPGQAVGAPDGVAAHAATVGDARCEGAPRGALWRERRQRVALGQPQGAWACGSRGGVCGPARCAGVARPRQRQRIARQEDEKVLRAQGRDHGPLGACEADGHGVAVAPRPQRGAPRRNGLRGVRELQALTFGGARSLETQSLCGTCPVDANQGRQGVVGRLGQASAPSVCEGGAKEPAR